MKNLIRFKVIDGKQIVIGFSRLSINPQKTNRVTRDILQNRPLPDYLQDAQDAVEVALAVKGKNRYKFLARAHARLSDAVKRYQIEVTGLKNHNVQYMPIKKNELFSDDTKVLRTAYKKLKKGELLTTAGAVVKDNRGKVFWKKIDGVWERIAITGIGIDKPNGAKLFGSLTAKQKDEIKNQRKAALIAALTPDKKTAAKNRELRTAGHTAVTKRSLAEITGTEAAQALAEAQAWLATETAAIETKYA